MSLPQSRPGSPGKRVGAGRADEVRRNHELVNRLGCALVEQVDERRLEAQPVPLLECHLVPEVEVGLDQWVGAGIVDHRARDDVAVGGAAQLHEVAAAFRPLAGRRGCRLPAGSY